MGKIIIIDNASLDGVIQDPAGDEGFRVGGWVGVIAGRPELAKATLDEALGTEALLLGRRSYQWLAARRGNPGPRQLPADAHPARARPGRRAAAEDLPGRARGRRAPLRRDQRQETHAPHQRPDTR
jgi:dihydrofolate reductase